MHARTQTQHAVSNTRATHLYNCVNVALLLRLSAADGLCDKLLLAGLPNCLVDHLEVVPPSCDQALIEHIAGWLPRSGTERPSLGGDGRRGNATAGISRSNSCGPRKRLPRLCGRVADVTRRHFPTVTGTGRRSPDAGAGRRTSHWMR
eukprot:365197-Chlamydomonas_euryale.AAC.9